MIKRTEFERLIFNNNITKDSILKEEFANEKVDHFDIFLSHSSKDKPYALRVRKILINLGFTVYLDLFDPLLSPKTPDAKTGERLCDIIERSRCIFYIHSQNSELSHWCPWELGYGDGSTKRVVILELIDDEASYKQEFLAIYPYLNYKKAAGTDKYYFWVHDRIKNVRYVELNQYLKGTEPYEHK